MNARARRIATVPPGLRAAPARRRIAAALAAFVLLLDGCATPAALESASPRGATVELDGGTHPLRWASPPGTAQALLVLEHGFTRSCTNLRTTMRTLADEGVLVLCVELALGGDPSARATALARAIADGRLEAPGGGALPERILVGGHSAGATVGLALGAALDGLVPSRLAGALLIDPVAADGVARDLARVHGGGRRPVLALLAAPHGCNARGSVRPLLQAEGGLEVVDLGPRSTHADIEGEDTTALARWACGTPEPALSAAWRARAAGWLRARLERPD